MPRFLQQGHSHSKATSLSPSQIVPLPDDSGMSLSGTFIQTTTITRKPPYTTVLNTESFVIFFSISANAAKSHLEHQKYDPQEKEPQWNTGQHPTPKAMETSTTQNNFLPLCTHPTSNLKWIKSKSKDMQSQEGVKGHTSNALDLSNACTMSAALESSWTVSRVPAPSWF